MVFSDVAAAAAVVAAAAVEMPTATQQRKPNWLCR